MHDYADKFFVVLDELAIYSEIGKRRSDLDLQSHPIDPYIVYYMASDQELIVYRILHKRRDFDAELRGKGAIQNVRDSVEPHTSATIRVGMLNQSRSTYPLFV